MKGVGRPVTAFIKSRGFAAQAAAQAQGSRLQTQQPQVTKLPNGVIVASVETQFPVSRVGLFFNAGARYEDGGNQGVTHALRNAAGMTSTNASAFAITNHIQQCGGNMACTTTRDHLIYTVEGIRSGIDECFAYMAQGVSHPEFFPHELLTLAPRMSLDLGLLAQDPHARLMEALHRAAYRGGMGRSLYSPEFMVGKHSGSMLTDFVTTHLTSDNVAVVGVGVDHDHLVAQAKGLNLPGGHKAPSKAEYHGGEVREWSDGPLVYAALVTEGAGVGSPDLLPLAVLQHVMGTGPYVKYGSNVASSKVAKAVAGASSAPFAATSVNSTYTDSGLFGFNVIGQSQDMGEILRAVTGVFAEATKGGVTDQDVTRAKSQLKSAVLMSQESVASLYDDIGIQALAGAQVLTDQAVAQAIDAVTTQQVQSVAKKVINSKPSMAALGDLSHTPYLDQLL